jgi:hypothetical protein
LKLEDDALFAAIYDENYLLSNVEFMDVFELNLPFSKMLQVFECY